MRSSVLVALALLTGCGNYSTEDVRFLAAVPTTEMLQLDVPSSAAATTSTGLTLDAQALVACGIGPAEIWHKARTTGAGINAGVRVVLWLADFIRSLEPSRRTADSREWGPFDDRKHPGYEGLITLTRYTDSSTCTSDVSVCYVFSLRARAKGQGDFQEILKAVFQGGSAERGHGSLHIDFDQIQSLGMSDPDSPGGEMDITYSRVGNPHSINLQLSQPAAHLTEFYYQWRRYLNGTGSFRYRFVDASGGSATVDSRFNAAGEGRADVTYVASGGFTAAFHECWDANACLTWLDDPWDINKICAALGCQRGVESACRMP